jgi:hypothetical protein
MFHFVLIALFLFAFQVTTLHIKHHLSEDEDQCHVCQASKHLDGSHHHHTSADLLMDVVPLQVNDVEEKVEIREAFDLTQTLQRKRIDLSCFKHVIPQNPPLAYYATAPPYIFS